MQPHLSSASVLPNTDCQKDRGKINTSYSNVGLFGVVSEVKSSCSSHVILSNADLGQCAA